MIVVECNPDGFFMKQIGFSKREVKHAGGKGKVLEKLRKDLGNIGIIDEDPESPQPSERYEYLEKDNESTIKLLVNRNDQSKRIIEFSPDFEGWLLIRAKQNGISLKKFNLPDDRRELHAITRIEDRQNFQKFIKVLIETRDSEIETVKKWVRVSL